MTREERETQVSQEITRALEDLEVIAESAREVLDQVATTSVALQGLRVRLGWSDVRPKNKAEGVSA